jgi:hypothetical protein
MIIYYVGKNSPKKKLEKTKIFFSMRFHPPKLQEFPFLGGLEGGWGIFFSPMNGNRHSARS